MKILVTGAHGQVGHELGRQAATLPYSMILCAREELDIADAMAVRQKLAEIKPDLVINAAAYTAVDRAEEEPLLAEAGNSIGPANLATACEERTIPLFHISTDYVFDGAKTGPYTEDDGESPLGVYGTTKLAGEEGVRANLPEHIILRTSWVFGAHGHNFVKTMLHLGASRTELRIVDDQHGCPTAAHDVALALLHLAKQFVEKSTLAWGTYNFCGTPAVTWRRFAEEIFRLRSAFSSLPIPRIIPITTDQYPTAARRPQNSELLCARIAQVFAIKQPDWRQSLEAVLREILGAEKRE